MERMSQDAGMSRPQATAAVAVGASILLSAGALIGIGMHGDGDAAARAEHPKSISLSASGVDGQGNEYDYAIAGEGSCAPYNHDDGLQAKAGNLKLNVNLSGSPDAAEPKFLAQHPDFAKNFALTSFDRMAVMYSALGIPNPTDSGADAAKDIENLFANEYYVTAPLSDKVMVVNTYCDTAGNLHDWHVVNLDKGTYVGGAMLATWDAETRTATFKNGKQAVIPGENLVVTVDMADGSKALMLATNKAGLDTNGDHMADVGCENVITVPPVGAIPTTTPETVETIPVPTTARSQTSTTGGTNTTVVITTTTGGITTTTPTTTPGSTTTQPGDSGKTTPAVTVAPPPTTASTTTTSAPTSETQPGQGNAGDGATNTTEAAATSAPADTLPSSSTDSPDSNPVTP